MILVRVETNPNDVHGMVEAKGILTQTGGTASHAALVARGMGRPCIVGASKLSVNEAKRMFTVDGTDSTKLPTIPQFGRYEDTLHKTNAGWRFKRRIFHFDVNLVPARAQR